MKKTDYDSMKIVKKIMAIIRSCKTPEHLECARRCIILAENNGYLFEDNPYYDKLLLLGYLYAWEDSLDERIDHSR